MSAVRTMDARERNVAARHGALRHRALVTAAGSGWRESRYLRVVTSTAIANKRRLCHVVADARAAVAEAWKAQRESIRAPVMLHHATHSGFMTRVPSCT